MKQMVPRWLVGVSFLGYGVSLMVGIGCPHTHPRPGDFSLRGDPDEEIFAPVVDYSDAYPQLKPEVLGEVSYRQLKKRRDQGGRIKRSLVPHYPAIRGPRRSPKP